MPGEKRALPTEFSPSAAHPSQSDDDGSRDGSRVLHSRKKVIGASPRTGQACDRCKSRKIRCDDTVGGCLPCRQIKVECKTTDRITHRATARGHTETLERDVADLRDQVTRLEQQLRDSGKEPNTGSTSRTSYDSPDVATQATAAFAWESRTGSTEDTAVKKTSSIAPSYEARIPTTHLPRYRSGEHRGENYYGISLESDLSPSKGLVLTLFNMTIDLADCIQDDNEDPLGWWMTYDAVLSSIYGTPHSNELGIQARLPDTYEECVMFYGYWNSIIQPGFPLLHKPDFEILLKQVYSGQKITAAQDVCIHMMLGFLKLQFSLRNRNGINPDPNQTQCREAMAHIHYSLSNYSTLLRTRSLTDMTALAMIVCTLRAFPRPGAAWFVTQSVMTVIIEIGLHRSIKAWSIEDNIQGVFEVEQRKRIFWTVYMCHVILSGKLGRPMLLKHEEYDIELPESLNEALVKADAGPEPHQCNFAFGLEYFKLTALLAETYTTLYTVRPLDNSYEVAISTLDQKIKKWKAALPPSLAENASAEAIASRAATYGLWLSYWHCELLLLVHHPGLRGTDSLDVPRRNLEVSAEASSKLIECVIELSRYKSYDTTWYNLTTFFAAMFTRLFVMNERVRNVKLDDLGKVEAQHRECLDIISDMGDLLGTGSGQRIRAKLEVILDKGMERIKQKTRLANPPVVSAPRPRARKSSNNSVANSVTSTVRTSFSDSVRNTQSEDVAARSGRTTIPAISSDSSISQSPHPAPMSSATSYPSPQRQSYASPQQTSFTNAGPAAQISTDVESYTSPKNAYVPSYPAQAVPSYYQWYPPTSNTFVSPDMSMQAIPPIHSEAYMYLPVHGTHHYEPSYDGQEAWRIWLESTGRTDPSEYMPASALVALSGHNQNADPPASLTYNSSIPTSAIATLSSEMSDSASVSHEAWPITTYETPHYAVLPDGRLQTRTN